MRDGMDRQEYLNKILEQIDNKTLQEEIKKEMSAHIDDREQYYRDCGYDNETAAAKAVERMGSPEAAADGFSKVHKGKRIITAILAVLSLLSSVVAFILFWVIFIFSIDDSTMGAGITEAMFLMYVIGLSAIGKQRNSRFICFVAIVDFIMMYVSYLLLLILDFNINELCSRIVLKLVCLLTGDFECLSAFWQVGRITVAPYLTYLSIAFYTVVFILLILVFKSVRMLKKTTYTLGEKRFANAVFRIQKRAQIFIALTMLILPFFGPFDKNADVTVKAPHEFTTIVIAQSNTPCPISEIPPEDIQFFGYHHDWSVYGITADFITKECGNKLQYKVANHSEECTVTKDYLYIECIDEYDYSVSESLDDETAYKFVSDNPKNWYKTESTNKISAAFNAYNQMEITIEKAP